MIRLISNDALIRTAVILAVVGLLFFVPILLTINALAVGLFMVGSLLVPLAIGIYLVAVIRELRARRVL